MDGSEEMLRYARSKAPQAEFLHRDARDFHLPATFHAAVSTFDSLNHILMLSELKKTFANVYAALLSGGFFVFDMNMETCFRSLWRGTSTSIEKDRVWIVRGAYDPDRKTGQVDLTVFRLEDQWRRYDASISEKCYSPGQITNALDAAGFRIIEEHDAADLGVQGDTGLGRSFFIAFK